MGHMRVVNVEYWIEMKEKSEQIPMNVITRQYSTAHVGVGNLVISTAGRHVRFVLS
jgi:hypothetical protein